MKPISIILTVVILILSFLIFRSIYEPIKFNKEKDHRYSFVIKRLKDIRTAQLAYKSENGSYTGSFDTLLNFVKNGRFSLIKQIGNVEDSAAVIIRDTIFVSVKDSLFPGNYPIDSIPYVPFGKGAKFNLQAGEIEKGKVKVKVFEAEDSAPFDKNKVLKVGSMTEPSNAGNWE
ncbi:MAG: hypothetical protein M3Q95_04055 [Bacteroidota bacterium]|nr:hypothetical protein [Bacteroidota bacterium]